MLQPKRYVCAVLLVLAAVALSGLPAHADTFDYTFSGTGSGTINGVAFTDQNFTFVVTGDTSAIVSSGGEQFLYNLGGTFTEDGTTYTLDATTDLGLNPAGPGIGGVELFNAAVTDGVGVASPDLFGGSLSTPYSDVSFIPLFTDTAPGAAFATTTGSVSITDLTALSYSAGPVPEPGSIAMLALGLGALACAGFFARRRSAVLSLS